MALADAGTFHQCARERPLRLDQLDAVGFQPPAGRARASELLALSNKALDRVAKLFDHRISFRSGFTSPP